MMNEADTQRLNKIFHKFNTGDEQQALQELRNWESVIVAPWDKVELTYVEILFLVDMHNAPEARERLEDLKGLLVSLVKSPSDGDELDPHVSLPMMTRHAEIRVKTEEEKEIEALQLIEDLMSYYPKQLSLPEFKALAEELATLRGFLLANAGRWTDARSILENVIPPEAGKDNIPIIWAAAITKPKSTNGPAANWLRRSILDSIPPLRAELIMSSG